MKKWFSVCILILSGCTAASNSKCSVELKSDEHTFFYEKVYTKKICMDYLLFLPEGYSGTGKSWPLVLFLHGRGESGDDLRKVTRHGPPKLVVTECRKFPFILLAPQCPAHDLWYSDLQAEILGNLCSEVIEKYNVDTDRVYATGISMGGGGVWRQVLDYPGRFAAVAVVSTFADPDRAGEFKHMPTWFFHGGRDPYFPVDKVKGMAEEMKKLGDEIRITIYPEARHDGWTQAYQEPELFPWLLKHRRQRSEDRKQMPGVMTN